MGKAEQIAKGKEVAAMIKKELLNNDEVVIRNRKRQTVKVDKKYPGDMTMPTGEEYLAEGRYPFTLSGAQAKIATDKGYSEESAMLTGYYNSTFDADGEIHVAINGEVSAITKCSV